jgi:uncharacterized protein (TIRG00374 family)
MADSSNPFSSIKASKIILPIVIGLGVVAWLFYREFKPEAFDSMSFTWRTAIFLLLAFICMFTRDFGYIIRIKVLADNKLTWMQAFRIIMLWEFSSAITPSAIGGTSIAILFVNKEGISLGKSSSIVLATSFLDELYFVLMFPLLLLVVNINKLFSIGDHGGSFLNEFFWIAVVGYSIKFAYTLVVSYGLFINPRGLKWLLMQIFRLKFLRRWKHQINEAGYEIVESSRELKRKPFSFWLKAFGSTFFSWTARYWVVNMILLAFFILPQFGQHFLIFARQLVMWIMQLIAPTPGGSGFAEGIFTRYLGDLVPVDTAIAGSVAVVLALIWRFISYYPYLIVGALIVPKWINDKFSKKRKVPSPSPIN